MAVRSVGLMAGMRVEKLAASLVERKVATKVVTKVVKLVGMWVVKKVA